MSLHLKLTVYLSGCSVQLVFSYQYKFQWLLSVLKIVLCLYFCSIRLVSHTQRGTIYPPLVSIAYTDVLVQNPETQSVVVRSFYCLS